LAGHGVVFAFGDIFADIPPELLQLVPFQPLPGIGQRDAVMKKGYINDFKVRLPKMDEVVKKTYSDHEVMLLLKKPNMKKAEFPEYRNWVIINHMLGTGNRAGTIVNMKIGDVDFNSSNIILKKMKSRKQFYIPLSRSLEQVLRTSSNICRPID